MSSLLFVFDFTVPEQDRSILHNWITDKCKKYCYQLEEGASGYRHFQGRISLKEKKRESTLINETKNIIKGIHWSPTSKENHENDFYVSKEDSRIEGPWRDTDPKPVYIPKQYRFESLLPWQQYIYDHYDEWDTRTINVVYDITGNNGKSGLVGYMCTRGLSQKIPYCNDYKDMMRIIMDTPKRRIYLIDLPRALGKDKIATFMAGIETLKDGYCYDDRYKYEECWFDSPNIWMFTNKIPDRSLLSADRWKIWEISKDLSLIPFGNGFCGASL